MHLIIKSVLARVQRDEKVILHHFTVEGSHPHIICTAMDAEQCHRFYGQVMKQLTDAIKRLTACKHLNLWEDRASVIEIPTFEDVVDKIAYCYANPSNDDLTACIEEYPGVSSWNQFLQASAWDECVQSEHAWIRLPMIPKLPTRSLSPRQDKFFCEKMLSASREKHTLKIYPFKWIGNFIDAPSREEVEFVKKRIIKMLRDKESLNAERRAKTGKKLLGASRLIRQPLLKPHTPKKQGRSIFVQTKFKDIRLRLIAEKKAIDSLCKEIYHRWRQGDFRAVWPPGTFPPPLPPQANAIA